MTRREFVNGLLMSSPLAGCVCASVANSVDSNLSVFLSDLHVPGDGVRLDRLDSDGSVMADRLACCVNEILSLRPRPARVVVFGDIAYLEGAAADYEKSKKILEPLEAVGIDVVLGLGNHDRRNAFFEIYPQYRTRSLVEGCVVQVVSLGSADLILLDSLNEENPSKAIIPLSEEKWMRETLPQWPRPFFVGAHHRHNDILFGNGPLAWFLVGLKNCRGFVHGHLHLWQESVMLNWQTGSTIPSIGLPSTGFWGDIGYVQFRTTPESAVATLVQKDFYFPRYQSETKKRNPEWGWRTIGNDGRQVRFAIS